MFFFKKIIVLLLYKQSTFFIAMVKLGMGDFSLLKITVTYLSCERDMSVEARNSF